MSRWFKKGLKHPYIIVVKRFLMKNCFKHLSFSDCFKNTIQYGKVVATLSTFFASTFLHGLNFQLGAVLLTLGVLTFVEAKIRQKLADLFNASIAARKNTTNVYRYR